MSGVGSFLKGLLVSACVVACTHACTQKTAVNPVDLLLGQAQAAIQQGDFKKARLRLEEAIAVAEKNEDDLGQVRALNDLAEVEKQGNRVEMLRSLYKKAAKICDRHVSVNETSPQDENWLKEATRTFSGLGAVHSDFGSFTVSESFYRKAIEFEERIDMPDDRRKVRREFDLLLKKVLQERHDVDSATGGAFAERGKRRGVIEGMLAHVKTTKMPPQQKQKELEQIHAKAKELLGLHDALYAKVREMLFADYYETGNYEKARTIIESDLAVYQQVEQDYLNGIKLDEETVQRIEILEKDLARIVPCYMKEERYKDAADIIARQVKLLERLQGPHWDSLANVYSQHADMLNKFQRPTDAINYGQKAINLYNRNPKLYRQNLRDRFRALAWSYAAIDDPRKALDAANRLLSLTDSPALPFHEVRALLDIAKCLIKHEGYHKDAVTLSRAATEAALLANVQEHEEPIYNVATEASDYCILAHDCKTAEDLLLRSYKVLVNSKNKLRPIVLLERTGVARANCKDWKNAIPAYQKALRLFAASYPKDATYAGINNKLAHCYVNLGRPQDAVPIFRESVKVCKASKDPCPYQSSLMQSTDPLRTLRRRAEARQACIECAKAVDEKSGESIRYAMSGLAMATSLSKNLYLKEQALSDYNSACKFYEAHKTQLEKFDPTCEHIYWLGTISFHIEQFENSRDYYLQYLNINKALGDTQFNARCLSQLARVSSKLGENEKAKEFARQSEEMRLRLKLPVSAVHE